MDPVPTLSRTPIPDASLGDPRNFVNRELSTLAFLERFLEEASDQRVSLLERLRFLGILSTSLDEFFMIRVAGLKQQLSGHVEETGPDAMTPADQLRAIAQGCHALITRQDQVFIEEVLPGLERAGVRLWRGGPLPPESQAAVSDFFQRQVLPVLTPI